MVEGAGIPRLGFSSFVLEVIESEEFSKFSLPSPSSSRSFKNCLLMVEFQWFLIALSVLRIQISKYEAT